MSAEKYKWSNLIRKYRNQEITPEELNELQNQIKESPLKEQQFNELTDSKKKLERMKDVYDFNKDVDAAWQRFMTRHPSIEFQTTEKKYNTRWYLAAAISIGVIIVACYFLFRNNSQKIIKTDLQKQPTTISQTKKDAAPTLKLSDGRQINLAAGEKVFPVIIGNVSIKYENGQVYIDVINNGNSSQVFPDNILTTPPGQRINLSLPDKSQITLNSGSSIKFPIPFPKDERWLELQGEALFDITKNRKHPCVVKTNSQLQILVYGTMFNVSDYAGEEFKTTLIKGEIKIAKGKKNYALKPGQRARLIKDEIVVDTVNTNSIIAWTKNELDLNNKNIKEVLLEIGRQYGKEVIFNGSFSDSTYDVQIPFSKGLPLILETLQKINHIQVKDSSEQLIVTNLN